MRRIGKLGKDPGISVGPSTLSGDGARTLTPPDEKMGSDPAEVLRSGSAQTGQESGSDERDRSLNTLRPRGTSRACTGVSTCPRTDLYHVMCRYSSDFDPPILMCVDSTSGLRVPRGSPRPPSPSLLPLLLPMVSTRDWYTDRETIHASNRIK